MRCCILIDLDRRDYREVLALQLHLADLKASGELEEDILILVEHSPVITAGCWASDLDNLRVTPNTLAEENIDLVHVGRGGGLTYHGPGQLVGYPLLNLKALYDADPLRYLRGLENILVKSVRAMGFNSRCLPGFTGVWVGEEKIAAIGVQVKQGITLHGFALNVNVDLSRFDLIYPCGIKNRSVTSLSQLTGKQIPLAVVKLFVSRYFAEETGMRLLKADAAMKETLLRCPVNQIG